jgi:hypothetical protein
MKTKLLIALLLTPLTPINAADPTVLLKGMADTELGVHGKGNVYAPEIHRAGDRWLMWYGGQGKDGHDRIHLASSADLLNWERKGVVLDEADVNHQNDPSVVNVAGVWWMFYTRAAHGISDEIAAATSDDGVHWKLHGTVLRPANGQAWDSLVVSRPSVLHEDGLFKMWYDARGLKPGATRPLSDKPEDLLAVADVRAVGFAESKDGLHWERPLTQPVFGEGAGAIHVSRHADGYALLYESHDGTRWAASHDGRVWKTCGFFAPKSGAESDSGGHVTPFLLAGGKGEPWQLFVGCNEGDWSRNIIARIPTAHISFPWQKERGEIQK